MPQNGSQSDLRACSAISAGAQDLERIARRLACANIPGIRDLTPDICAALVQFLAESFRREDALCDALEDLLDEQNGPPLFTREHEWRIAVNRARRVLDEIRGDDDRT